MPGGRRRLIEPDLSDERIRELDQAFIDGEVADTCDVIPTGALHLLEVIPADRWAIVTSGPRRLALARLGAPACRFRRFWIRRTTSGWEADPAPVQLGARRLGLPRERCLVIEDAPAGIAAACAAGCQAPGVLTTFPALDADTVKDLTEVSVDVTSASRILTYPSSEAPT